ncbi:hypothetical protein WJX73_009520 [Symbiochloris irregularis]|uniref:Protein N-terminal glutamine amidohydrolase n=1 Tax=Symbiochloris irregularis TaxID=706552 RepID=A0AAW1NQR2_9CHLO
MQTTDNKTATLAEVASKPLWSHTKFYCEENVFLLCRALLQRQNTARLFAVFVSNLSRKVCFWMHSSEQDPSGRGPVVWDYHVFALSFKDAGCPFVWDLDSSLQMPCPAGSYISSALRPELILDSTYHRRYRVVEAHAFLAMFASDRSHMQLPDGSWQAPPPPYPCITSPGGDVMNLPLYLDMSMRESQGAEMMNQRELDCSRGLSRNLCGRRSWLRLATAQAPRTVWEMHGPSESII